MGSITVSPAATYPTKRKAERSMAMTLKGLFKETKKTVVPKMVAAYKSIMEEHRPATTKALDGERNHVLDELDLDAWVDAVDDIDAALSPVQTESAKKALTTLKVSDKGLFNKVNDAAASAAKDRAAALVGMRYSGKKLVPNPSARYAITETTRTGIRELVTNALTDGMTVPELASALEDAYQFSDRRAETIARTEVATAHVDGTVEAWKQSGQVDGKSSLTGSGDVCDICEGNEGDGVIGIDDDFSSGDDAPPYHPNCVCVLLAELTDTDE